MKRIVKLLFIAGFALSTFGIIRIGYFEAKAELAQHLMETAWQENKRLVNQFGGKLNQRIKQAEQNIKPWPWADTWPVLKLMIPSVDFNYLVLKDASGESLAFGPGLLTNAVYPGEPGNSFIVAHRDTHFKNLGSVKKDALIEIEDRNENVIRFKIDQIKIVDSRIERPITDSADVRVTLVTCYPFNAIQSNTPYRYLVSGKLVPEEVLNS